MWATSSAGNARYWCRRCNAKGFADAKVGQEEIEQAKKRWLKQKAEKERERQQWIEQLQNEAYWRGWHDAMSAQARKLWEGRGLTVEAQNYLELGYTESPPRGDSPALTIPYHDRQWDVVALQWRFVNPPQGMGKYSQPKGQPLPHYVTDPTATSNKLLIVEGAIKSAVTWWELVVKEDLDYNVVGIPSSTPSADVMTAVSEIDHSGGVWIMTDPDTFEGRHPPARRIGEWFDEPLYVTLPLAPDDLLVEHGWTGHDIHRFIVGATL